jgi:uncharacterized protein (DUF1697 family)
MTAFVALLRAVNVGGTSKLPMRELMRLCEAAGFTSVQTYIASGNVVFKSKETEAWVKARLEQVLHDCAGKPVSVLVRTASEIAEVLANNPFPKALPKWTVAIFLDEPPPRDTLKTLSGQRDEEVRLGRREILCPLRQRHGDLEAQDPRRQGGHGAQYEHYCQARRDGRRALGAIHETHKKCYHCVYGRRAEESLTRGFPYASRQRALVGDSRRLEVSHVRTGLQFEPNRGRCGLR